MEECRRLAAQELLAEMGRGLPQSSGSRRAGSIPPRHARPIPSACTGLLTGSDSCVSIPAPVAGDTGLKQGGKHCHYLLTRFPISLLSEWVCFLIYFDLLEN